MSKRATGQFKRRPRDFYPTPEAAVIPLLPYLRRDGIKYFAEPCAGSGDLVRHLEKHGLTCTAQADLADSEAYDARGWTSEDYKGADCVITNTPWQHYLMAAIMEHQARFAPGWFLVYTDWLFNVRSADILARLCTDVVPVGRVKWIPDTDMAGFDNACWVRMSVDKDPEAPMHLWPRGV